MSDVPSENLRRVLAYLAQKYGEPANHSATKIGAGIDGTVFYTTAATVVKAHVRESSYLKEVDAYDRLKEHSVVSVNGHAVPELLGSRDQLLVIEMTPVNEPFLLDFASSELDIRTEFEPGAMAYWFKQRRSAFGTNWPAALAIYNFLWERYGICYHDLTPKNCCFLKPGDDLPEEDVEWQEDDDAN